MNQPRSLAKRLRWPLLCLGLLAVLAGLAGWLLLSDPINPRAFERIQLGMTEEEIETVIGMPADFYESELLKYLDIMSFPRGRLIDRKAIPIADARPIPYRWTWTGNEYWIKVLGDEDGKTVAAYLYERPNQPSFLYRLRTWISL